MKDYSLNYDDSKKFILSYKIENGKIVAKLASGESCTVPYSEENENKIISRMEEQARYAQPKPLRMLDKILTISQPLMLPIAIMNFVNNGGWFYGMFLAIIVEGAIYYPAKTIINAIKKRDIKKLNYFLDHKEELSRFDIMIDSLYKSIGIKIEIYNSLTDDYDNDIFIRRKYESARDLIYGDILYDRDGFYSGLKEELLNTKKKYLPPYIHTLKLKYKTLEKSIICYTFL